MNPTGNSIAERISTTIGNSLRCGKHQNLEEVVRRIQENLNFTYNRVLKRAPAQFLKLPSPIDPLNRTKEVSIEKTLSNIRIFAEKEGIQRNKKRRDFVFRPNMLVSIKNPTPAKLGKRWSRPARIIILKRNENVALIEGKHKREWVNIKRIKSFGNVESKRYQDDATVSNKMVSGLIK